VIRNTLARFRKAL